MRFKTTLVLAAALAGVTLAGASGQERVDAAAIAKKGAPGVPACESCHTGAGQFPTIQGQLEHYLIAQLADFKKGLRASDVMAPIAKNLSTAQITALGKYYAEQPRKKAPGPDADSALVEKGRVLATQGDIQRDLNECERCHGQEGKGGDFAALSGQNPTYLMSQLKALRDGKRENDELGIMRTVAKKLTDDDIKAVAAYYHQVLK